MEWLQFILALAGGRQYAVIVARSSDLSFAEMLFLNAVWFLALGCLVVYFVDRPWVASRLAKLRDLRSFQWLLGSIPRTLHAVVAFAICFAPGGLWWGILLMTLWRYRWYQRVLLVAAGSTASYFAYEAVMAPLGSYTWLVIPLFLIPGLAARSRDRLATLGNRSLQRYRLLFSKAAP